MILGGEKLDTFQPNGLNEREVALFYLNFISHTPIHIVLEEAN